MVDTNIKVPVRNMRAANKVVFKIPSRCTDRFLNSPSYKGSVLCNDLEAKKKEKKDAQPKFRRLNPGVCEGNLH